MKKEWIIGVAVVGLIAVFIASTCVKSYEICECQSRFYINLTQEELNELIGLNITNYYGESITKIENLKPDQNEGRWDAFAHRNKVEKDSA